MQILKAKIKTKRFKARFNASVIMNGIPIEIATIEEMNALLVAENVGKIYKYIGVTNATYTKDNLYQVIEG